MSHDLSYFSGPRTSGAEKDNKLTFRVQKMYGRYEEGN